MLIVVRRASEDDVGTLAHLNGAVQTLHARLHPNDFKPVVAPCDAQAFFSEVLRKPDGVVGITEVDSAPVGYVWFDVQLRPETPFTPARRRIYVHHVSVLPEAHRRGVGSALMNYVERRAVSEDAEEIALAAWSANVGAQHFFASHGFTRFTVALRKTFPAVRQ